MLDSDLAELYQVPTKRVNEAVRRNVGRFPPDFMFQLNEKEVENLRSQNATSSSGHGGRRHPPYAFTEHGVAMLSSVLTSDRAVELNILIIRAFVQLRKYLIAHKDLARKLEDVERTQQEHSAHIEQIYGYIQRLIEPTPDSPKRRIGFATQGNELSAAIMEGPRAGWVAPRRFSFSPSRFPRAWVAGDLGRWLQRLAVLVSAEGHCT